MDTCNKLWTIDQTNGNGIKPIVVKCQENISNELSKEGYIALRYSAISEVFIPSHKQKTYDLCSILIEHRSNENINKFIDYIIKTNVMKKTKNLLERKLGNFTEQKFKDMIKNKWFLSGFDHIFIGEGINLLKGYHFWYKYWLDTINYNNYTFCSYFNKECPEFLAIHLINYKYDQESGKEYSLYKTKCGLFLGCSPEFLISLGLILFYGLQEGQVKIKDQGYSFKTRIGKEEYSLILYYADEIIKSVYPVCPNFSYDTEVQMYYDDIRDIYITNIDLGTTMDTIILKSECETDLFIKACYINIVTKDRSCLIKLKNLFFPPFSSIYYHIKSDKELPRENTTLELLNKNKKKVNSVSYTKKEIEESEEEFGYVTFRFY